MRVNNAKEAVSIAESRFDGFKALIILDYDSQHYVIGMGNNESNKIGGIDNGMFIGVDKNTGIITRFYPNADILEFQRALNDREVKIVQ